MHDPSSYSPATCVQRTEEYWKSETLIAGVVNLYEPSPTPCLYVAPTENMVTGVRAPVIPLFLAKNSTPSIPQILCVWYMCAPPCTSIYLVYAPHILSTNQVYKCPGEHIFFWNWTDSLVTDRLLCANERYFITLDNRGRIQLSGPACHTGPSSNKKPRGDGPNKIL